MEKQGFHSWIDWVFDHEVTSPEWFFGDDVPGIRSVYSDELVLEHVRRLFRDASEALRPFSAEQSAQGLWFLATQCSDISEILADKDVSTAARLDCISSMGDLFETYFASHCQDSLSHLDTMTDKDERPTAYTINFTCYMWWDLLECPLIQPSPVPEIAERALEVMKRGLRLDSIACQESALHGLGHWTCCFGSQVREIVDRFLAASPELCPDLRSYALSARAGDVP